MRYVPHGDTIVIMIVKSRVTGMWGYCPQVAMKLLKPEYCEDAHAATAGDAVNDAMQDDSIRASAVFVVERE